MRELIGYAQDKGYQIVCHTNSTDCYCIAEDFSDDIVIKKKDGSLEFEARGWSGGTMYHLCPQKALEFAKRDLPKVADLGFKGLHYIDVMSVVALRKCYDPNHPVNERDTDKIYREIANDCKKLFGGFASEGVFDFAAGYLDYGLYVSFGKHKKLIFDKEVPLWQLVYHGIILSNPSTATVNYPVKAPENRLKLIECDDMASLQGSVRCIAETYEEYKDLRDLQYEFMVKHEEKEPGVFEVTYSDGTVIEVDYTNMSVQRR